MLRGQKGYQLDFRTPNNLPSAVKCLTRVRAMVNRCEVPLARPVIKHAARKQTRFSLWKERVKLQRISPIAARIGAEEVSRRTIRIWFVKNLRARRSGRRLEEVNRYRKIF
jgi:hypothetical protein